MGANEGATVDRDLVEAAQRGDREAFVDLIRARADRLFAIAQRILRDVDRAEDALQDALVIAWRDLRGPPRSGPVRRLAPAPPRQRVHRPGDAGTSPRGQPPGAADRRTCGARRAPRVADRDQLERGFRRLSAEQRAILVLRHYVGLRAPEIAEMLGIPPGTVRSRLHNAHRAMRAALEADARAAGRGRSNGMTRDRDIERLLDAWLADGPMQVSDRAFDEAVGRVHRQRQRPAWRLLWKEPTHAPLKVALGAAAIIVVFVAGFAVWAGPKAWSAATRCPRPRCRHRHLRPPSPIPFAAGALRPRPISPGSVQH